MKISTSLAFVLTVSALVLAEALLAQNTVDFFKVYQTPRTDAPLWQQMMYAEDPDVFAVDDAYKSYYRAHTWRKDLQVRNYIHWRRRVAPHLTAEGKIRPASPAEESAAYSAWKKRKVVTVAQRDSAQWQPIGPFATYQDGNNRLRSIQANVYSLTVSPTDSMRLYAGTEGGGTYRSRDGGRTWQACSYSANYGGGVSAIEVHPINPDIVFVGANRRFWKTTDGGDSWLELYYHNGTVNDFKYKPGNAEIVFACTSNGLYQSNDAGSTWTQTLDVASYDLEFKPGDPQVVYVLTDDPSNKRPVVQRSSDGGNSWVLLDNNWYMPAVPDEAQHWGGKLAVTPLNSDLIYAAVIANGKEGDNGWTGLYNSTDGGLSWQNPAPRDGSPYDATNEGHWSVASYGSGYHQGFYNFDLEISLDDPAKLWMGTVRLVETLDSGRTWTAIGAANSQRFSYQHADIQDIEVDAHGRVWVASDGGIDVSYDQLAAHQEARIIGLDAADFWGFANGWNEDLLLGGKYHNGNSAHYQTFARGEFKHVGGVEEPTGYTNAMYPRRAIFGHWSGNATRQYQLGDAVTDAAVRLADMSKRPAEHYTTGRASMLAFDVRYGDHVYLGRDEKLWTSIDGGASFSVSWTFPDEAQIQRFTQSRKDPKVWYAFAKKDGEQIRFFRSEDGATSFTEVPCPGTRRNHMLFDLNPLDENEVWVLDVSGRNLWRSLDGGQSWSEKTPPNVSSAGARHVMVVPTTEGTAVYLATLNHLKLYASWTDTWSDFDQGLPYHNQSLALRPFYPEGKLRLGTSGRGIWESPLAHESMVQALPMTARRAIFCNRDTLTLESHSILDQRNGATFTWDISPAPLYISDVNTRRPKVLLGADGSYDVTLTVTDAMGRTDTRTIEGMWQLTNTCAIGTRAGMALALDLGSSDIQGTALPGDSLTLMMWVRPDSMKYGMLMMARDASTPATGIHMWENGELGIHLNGGSWSTRSGLLLDSAAWNHVAMTIAPDGVRLYLNGKEKRMTTSAPDFTVSGNWRIGGDPGWSSRNHVGDLDEVSVWNRALSIEEIRAYRHHTLDPMRDRGLVHYFQFDVPQLGVYDLLGNAPQVGANQGSYIVSNAPVAAGQTFAFNDLSANTWVALGTTGATLRVDEAITAPVTISYLAARPHDAPQRPRSPEGYWIINDYSTTPFSSNFTLELTADDVDVPGPMTDLLRRNANDTSAIQWTTIGEGLLTNSSYRFDSLTGGLGGQYFYGTEATFEVALASFTGDSLNREAHLDWSLYGYDAADTYTLEHRVPGSNSFAQRFTRPAYRQVDTSLVDTGLAAGLHTYRLALTDADAVTMYSHEVDVVIAEAPVVSGTDDCGVCPERSRRAKTSVTVGPNPVQAGREVTFKLDHPVNRLSVKLFDAKGREMKRSSVRNGASLTLYTKVLVPGLYFYEVETEAALLMGQVVVE